MASLVDRIGIDVLSLILDRYLDTKSRLRFERTSKEHQQLVIESFQRIKVLSIGNDDLNKIPCSGVIKLMFRCGPNLRHFQINRLGPHIDENDSETVARMAREFPLLIELPTYDLRVYRM